MANQVLTSDILVFKNGEFKTLRNQSIYKDEWYEIASSTVDGFNEFSVYNNSNDTWYTLTTPIWAPMINYALKTNDKEGDTYFNYPYWEDANYQGNSFKLFNFNYDRFSLIADSKYPSTISLFCAEGCITNYDENVEFELVYSNNPISNWFSNIKINPMYLNETTVYNYRVIVGFDVIATANGTPNNNTLHAEYLAKGVKTGIYYFGIKLYTYTIEVL